MIHAENAKAGVPFEPVSKTNGAEASGYVDCKGFSFAAVDVILGTSNAATNTPAVVISHGDTTSTYTALATSGTEFTNPSALTGTNGAQVYRFNVDMRGRKRYLKVSVTPTTTQLCAAIINLHQGAEVPVSTNDTGVADLIHAI